MLIERLIYGSLKFPSDPYYHWQFDHGAITGSSRFPCSESLSLPPGAILDDTLKLLETWGYMATFTEDRMLVNCTPGVRPFCIVLERLCPNSFHSA
jgi:hypothetical protein